MNPDVLQKFIIRDPVVDPKNKLHGYIAHVGWTEEEIVEISMDYYFGNNNFDWTGALMGLWAKTCDRIHSNMDVKYKFQYYNDWKPIVMHGMKIYKIKIAQLGLVNGANIFSPNELLLLITRRERFMLPSDQRETYIILDLLNKILKLNEYILMEPREAYMQLCDMRKKVAQDEIEAEAKREANRLRKMKKRQHKKRK